MDYENTISSSLYSDAQNVDEECTLRCIFLTELTVPFTCQSVKYPSGVFISSHLCAMKNETCIGIIYTIRRLKIFLQETLDFEVADDEYSKLRAYWRILYQSQGQQARCWKAPNLH